MTKKTDNRKVEKSMLTVKKAFRNLDKEVKKMVKAIKKNGLLKPKLSKTLQKFNEKTNQVSDMIKEVKDTDTKTEK